MDKLEYYSAMKMNEVSIHVTTKVNPEKTKAKWKKPVTKGHIVYDSIYVKGLESANTFRKAIDGSFQGLGGGDNEVSF